MSLVLTTASVPDRDKLTFWRDAMGEALEPMTVTPRGDGPFAGRITTDRIGCLRVSTVEADAQRTSRTATHIARTPGTFLVVGIQTSGTVTLAQDGRQATAGTGDIVVYDTARPYCLDYPERFSARLVHVPHHVLGLPDEEIRRVAGTVIGTEEGFGAVLMPFLATLGSSAHSYSPAVGRRLAAGVVDLLATLVAERTGHAAPGRETSHGQLVLRVRDHIERNLGDPALSPEVIAKAHHISVRYLHRLFEDEGITVGRLIQRRRLEQCARELARSGRTAPTVSSVAQRWGFVNPAHFSRAFRGVYGLAPREWRRVRVAEAATHGNPAACGTAIS
ncbi:helix-turn-helix domain-containing protein [Streptomyces sp. NPDC101194]|uniref:AraC-like ligand-binding domain-containing protein n=1 Tax=Streptomyces sp. NPDC101194 TaxID=3366127 RepID=UPI003819CD3C